MPSVHGIAARWVQSLVVVVVGADSAGSNGRLQLDRVLDIHPSLGCCNCFANPATDPEMPSLGVNLDHIANVV